MNRPEETQSMKNKFYIEELIEQGDPNILKAFEKLEIDINEPLYSETTAIQVAAENNHFDIIEILLKAGADINSDAGGSTALHRAARLGNVGMIDFLVERGANINSLDSEGETPLIVAAYHDLDSVIRLIELGADLNVVSGAGYTALSEAISGDNIAIFDWIITHGFDWNYHNRDGDYIVRVLIETIFDISVEMLERVLATLSPDLNVRFKYKKKDGRTLLILAAMDKENIEKINLLLEYGADPFLKDSTGKNFFRYVTGDRLNYFKNCIESLGLNWEDVRMGRYNTPNY